jgi:aminoglycoside phosphotransferase
MAAFIKVSKQARSVVMVSNRQARNNALLKSEWARLKIKKGLTLDCPTRFSSKVEMLDCLLIDKGALRTVASLHSTTLSSESVAPFFLSHPPPG